LRSIVKKELEIVTTYNWLNTKKKKITTKRDESLSQYTQSDIFNWITNLTKHQSILDELDLSRDIYMYISKGRSITLQMSPLEFGTR
jgi:hypothetical protein